MSLNTNQEFIHLHVHSEFSLSDGIIRIDDLAEEAYKKNFSAIALTDISNLFGLIKFYKAARKNGIKPIIGVEINLVEDNDQSSGTLVLLAKDNLGYKNLTKIVSRSYVDGQKKGVPHVNLDWLESNYQGIIALSGGQFGYVGKSLLSGDESLASDRVIALKKIFNNNFFLEIQRVNREREEEHNLSVIDLSIQHEVPLVATNDVRFLEPIDSEGNLSDFEAHEARVCIQKGETLSDPRRKKIYSPKQYLTSTEEMINLFSDIPEALQNTVEISKLCNLEIDLGKFFLPDFDVPEGKSNEDMLRESAEQGLKNRIEFIESSVNKYDIHKEKYAERLEYELNMICKLDFAGYFLIVADFVNWAQENEIPVGPGRGSGAGSITAYALGITSIDPIKYDLLFERFLNPERVSNPDFDIDFCRDGRDRVLDYVTQKYGKESVAQIGTRGTMAARAVIKDVVRVLDKPYWFGESLVNAMPDVLGISLKQAYKDKEFKELVNSSDGGLEVYEMALKLEGIARSVGTHAAGVVIAPTALTDFTPLILDEEKGTVASQFDMGDVEAVGLVKFDFLGLKTLTIIDRTLKRVNLKNINKELRIDDLPLNDKKTFSLLQKADTTGVFQLESRGMREYLKQLVPNRFEDIVSMNALYRPGALGMNMVQSYIERKHGREDVTYGHEAVKNILSPTYGVIVYQEQVMQIAQDLAGFSLGQADILRRAMGKKKKEEMEQQRSSFIEGSALNKVDKKYAGNLFDQIEQFAGYGFNRSHSVGYALIAYQTAWLKAHFPASFMASVLSCEIDSTDRVQMFVDECREMKLKVTKPDINKSEYLFLDISDDEILYGLGAIKGVGESLIGGIQTEREISHFTNLEDFCLRMNKFRINKRVLEALIGSGAMDGLGVREDLFRSINATLKKVEHLMDRRQSGISDLFEDEQIDPDPERITLTPENKFNLPIAEYKSLGFYLESNPIKGRQNEITRMCSGLIGDLTQDTSFARLGGFISQLNMRQGKRGRFAFITLVDLSGKIEVSIWADIYDKFRSALKKGQAVIIEGDIEKDEFSSNEFKETFKLIAQNILTLDDARREYCKYVNLKMNSKNLKVNLEKIKKINIEEEGKKTPLLITYSGEESEADLSLPEEYNLNLNEDRLLSLEKTFGKENIQLVYDTHLYLH